MASETEITLAEILSLVLGRSVPPGQPVQRAAEARWDSLKHLEIIMAVESAFGTAFTAEEMAEVSGSQDLLRKIGGVG